LPENIAGRQAVIPETKTCPQNSEKNYMSDKIWAVGIIDWLDVSIRRSFIE
jgi:hypothetical protein